MECNGTRQFDEAVAGEAAVSSCMRQLSTLVSGTPCPSHPCFTCLVQLNLCASMRLSLCPQLTTCVCVCVCVCHLAWDDPLASARRRRRRRRAAPRLPRSDVRQGLGSAGLHHHAYWHAFVQFATIKSRWQLQVGLMCRWDSSS
jgi:hypothetical protein